LPSPNARGTARNTVFDYAALLHCDPGALRAAEKLGASPEGTAKNQTCPKISLLADEESLMAAAETELARAKRIP
jgi:hypothetical protein